MKSDKGNVGGVSFVNFESKINKRGAVNWTVGKLINIILLVVVLALVVYGISIGGLGPLVDQIEGRFDEVLIMFNLRDDVSFEECYSSKVVDLGGGEVFLEKMGLSGEDVGLNVCRDRVCNFSGALKNYRSVGGRLEWHDEGKWVTYASLFGGNLDTVKFDWELYHKGVDILEGAGLKAIYDGWFTGSFVLYGDGSGVMDGEVFAVWKDDSWKVSEGAEIIYEGDDDNKAIDAFVGRVWGGDDDKVFWREVGPELPDEYYIGDAGHGRSIGGLVGVAGDDDEIDDEEDVRNLKIEFAKIKKRLLSKRAVSLGDVDAVDGRSFFVREREFVVDVVEGEGFPVVRFVSGGDEYGFLHSTDAKVNSDFVKGIKLRYFPVLLVELGENIWIRRGNEEYYRLPKNFFDDAYEASLVNQFLGAKCR